MPSVHEILLNITGNSDDARRDLREISQALRQVPNARAEVVVDKVEDAKAKLRGLAADLNKIDRSRVSPEVNVQISQALAEITAFQARLDAIPNEKNVRLDLNTRGNIERDLALMERGILKIGGDLESAASGGLQAFGAGLGEVAQTVKSVTPIVNGLAILIGVKLVAGLFALAGAAGAAVVALGGLANAFVGALGPAAAVLLAFFARLSKVLEAKKATDQANLQGSQKDAQGNTEAAAAAERRVKAEESLRDAQEGVTTAEQGLAEARRQAAAAIKDANDAAGKATRDVVAASQAVRDATVEAYRAMADAAESARDAVLSLADAQLSLDEAKLAVRNAEAELRDFEKASGAAAGSLQDLFKKFTNVDVNFDAAKFRQALTTEGIKPGSDQARELEGLILRVRRARLGEKQATDSVHDSEVALQRARQENLKFQQQGISAYKPLTDAIRGLGDAQDRAAKATSEANRLNQLGVDGAPGVISAKRALRDAEQQLTTARRESAKANDLTGMSAAAAKAQELTDRLTGSELKFLDALRAVGSYLTAFFAPATDAIFKALSDSIAGLPILMAPLQAAFTAIGQAFASVIDTFGQELINPRNIELFNQLARGAAQVVLVLGSGVFLQFFRVMRNLAAAVMPVLVSFLQDVAHWLKVAADATTGKGAQGRIGGIFFDLTDVLKSILELAGALADVLFSLFVTMAPASKELVDWITKGVQAFGKWLHTAGGQKKVKQFFEDTLPAVKEIVKFVVKLGVAFLQFLQFISPVLAGMTSAFNFVLDVVNAILSAMNDLTSNPFFQAIKFAIGQFLGLGTVLKVFRLIIGAITELGPLLLNLGGKVVSYLAAPFIRAAQFILGALEGIIPGIAGIGSRAVLAVAGAIAAAAGFLFQTGGNIVRAIINGAASLLGSVFSFGGRIIAWLWSGIKVVFNGLWGAGRWIVNALWSGIQSMAVALFNAGAWVVGKVKSGLESLFNAIYGVGQFLLKGLIDGLVAVGKWVWDAIKGLADKIVGAVKDVLGIHSPSKVFFGLGQSMLRGLIDGFTSGDVVSFIQDHLGGLGALSVKLAKIGLVDIPKSLGGLGGPLNLLPDLLPQLASGGLVRGRTFAELGEGSHPEAVLPLSKAVLRALGNAIAANLHVPIPGGGTLAMSDLAATPGEPRHLEQHFHIPEAAGGGQPDAKVTAVQLSDEMRKRGGS